MRRWNRWTEHWRWTPPCPKPGWRAVRCSSAYVPDVARRDSLALEAFRRVADLDPEFVPALYHLQELTLRSGDIDETQRLYRQYARARPDSAVFSPIRIMLQCLVDGPDAVQWSAEVLSSSNDVLLAARSLSVGGTHLECAERGFVALRAYVPVRVGQPGSGPRSICFRASTRPRASSTRQRR